MTIVLFLLLDCAYLGNDVSGLYGGLQYQKIRNINFCEFMLGRDFVIQQKDCITLVLTWLYYIKSSHWKRDATEVK